MMCNGKICNKINDKLEKCNCALKSTGCGIRSVSEITKETLCEGESCGGCCNKHEHEIKMRRKESERELDINKIHIIRLKCEHCNKYIGIEGEIPNFCPNCGRKLEDYDVDERFVYVTIKL